MTVYVLDSGVRSSHVEFRRPTPANLAAAAAAAAASTARVSIVSRSTTNTTATTTTTNTRSNSSNTGDATAGGSKITGNNNSSNPTGGPGGPASAAASDEPDSGTVVGGGDGSSSAGVASGDSGGGDGGSRVVQGFSAVGNPDTEDCYGHGTHVAALAGGLSYGVAKNITIVPVQVRVRTGLTQCSGCHAWHTGTGSVSCTVACAMRKAWLEVWLLGVGWCGVVDH